MNWSALKSQLLSRSDVWRASVPAMLAVVYRAGITFGIQKLMAMQHGAAGVALLGQAIGIIAMIITLPNDGVHRGLVQGLPQASGDKQVRVFQAAVLADGLGVFAIVLALLLGQGPLFDHFPTAYPVWQWAAAMGLATVLVTLHLLSTATLLAKQQVVKQAWLSMLGHSLILTGLAIGLYLGGLAGGLMGFILGQGAVSIVTLTIAAPYFPRGGFTHWDLAEVKEALQPYGPFILFALATTIAGKLLDVVVRDWAMQHLGLELTGWWQAITRTADLYILPVTVWTSQVFYSYASKDSGDFTKSGHLLRQSLGVVMSVVSVGMLIVFGLGKELVTLVTASSFADAAQFWPGQLLGDWGRILALVMGYFLMAQGKVKLLLWFEVGSGLLYLPIVWLLYPLLGAQSLVWAHALRYALFALAHVVATWPWLFKRVTLS